MSTESPVLEVATIPPDLEKAVVATGLAPDGVQTLRSAFAPHFVKFHELATSAANVPATSPKVAGALRLELKKVRVAADKTRKELKEDSLRRGKAIDGINALLEYQLVPIEDAMEKIEKAAEIAEANRVAALKAVRVAELTPFSDPTFYDLGKMPDAQWEQLLAGAKSAHEAKLAAAARAEEGRVAKEKAEAAERERIRAENERLKQEASDKEAALKAERERVAKEQADAAEVARKEREAIENKAADEREKLRKQQSLARAKLKKAEDDLAAERAAQEKKAADDAAVERQRQADAVEAERKAAAAPDKEKLAGYVESLAYLSVPYLGTAAGQILAEEITNRKQDLVTWIRAQVERL